MRRSYIGLAGLLATALAIASGCSESQPTPDAATEEVTTTRPPEEATESPSDPQPPAPAPETPTSEVTSGGTEFPDVPSLEPGVPLGLSDFFRPTDNWNEQVYNVADFASIQGIASEVGRCGLDDAEQIELRTENKFETLSFRVGQANDSDSSSQGLLVEVIGDNGPPLHTARVGWNEVVPFEDLPISAVGAVKIRVALDDGVEGCGYGGDVIAVLIGTTVS